MTLRSDDTDLATGACGIARRRPGMMVGPGEIARSRRPLGGVPLG
ncbi:hypothetical protein [Krasilnikovia sp. MM14-A1004]